MRPLTDVRRVIVEGEHAVAECVDHFVVDGVTQSFPIGVFFVI
jgi:hypothetical protein